MKDYVEQTLDYYNENAAKFTGDTVGADMTAIQDEFLSYVKPGGNILDLGCGSGRDSKYFLDKGYEVIAVDGSEELCGIAAELIGQDVYCSTFEDLIIECELDGIWACSSLLHLKKDAIHDVVAKLSKQLVAGGVFYMSFKYGDFSGMRNGRFFTDMTEDAVAKLFADIPELKFSKQSITRDVRPGRENEKWLNIIVLKKE